MQRITSKDNNTVKHISKLIKSSSYRNENNEFVIEGVRLCSDAVESGVQIKTAVFSDSALEKYSEQINKIVEISKAPLFFRQAVFSNFRHKVTTGYSLCMW